LVFLQLKSSSGTTTETTGSQQEEDSDSTRSTSDSREKWDLPEIPAGKYKFVVQLTSLWVKVKIPPKQVGVRYFHKPLGAGVEPIAFSAPLDPNPDIQHEVGMKGTDGNASN